MFSITGPAIPKGWGAIETPVGRRADPGGPGGRAPPVFATQLTGECVKLERLHHVYVPETGCSTYIHHTVDTETPFSYLLLKGSQIASFQAGAWGRPAPHIYTHTHSKHPLFLIFQRQDWSNILC